MYALLLNAPASCAQITRLARVRYYQLVNNDVVGVQVQSGQLLDQTLSLVERQELCNANTNKRRLLLVQP
jgi:hypothetical protein